jgi:hypothetical protein
LCDFAAVTRVTWPVAVAALPVTDEPKAGATMLAVTARPMLARVSALRRTTREDGVVMDDLPGVGLLSAVNVALCR